MPSSMSILGSSLSGFPDLVGKANHMTGFLITNLISFFRFIYKSSFIAATCSK